MAMFQRFSYLKDRANQVYCRPSGRFSLSGCLIAIGVQALLFILSIKLDAESEVLFSLLYVASALLTAIFIGKVSGMIAGVLAGLSVDFHYIHPAGKMLSTPESFAFLVVTLVLVQITLIGVRVLQAAAFEAENARIRLEEAVRIREEILAVVAHDLRQPLSAFSLKQQVAMRALAAGNSELAIRHLQDGARALTNMDFLLRDLLDGTKIETGKLTLNCIPMAPEELIRRSYETYLQQATTKGLRLRLELPSQNLAPVLADPHRVMRVLSNLITNAMKFTPKGGEIILSVMSTSAGIEFRVQDTGFGIRPENVAKLFQKYWQDRQTAHLGTGLGLYICHGVIEAHRGELWYEARRPAGSAFCFTLPVTEALNEPSAVSHSTHETVDENPAYTL